MSAMTAGTAARRPIASPHRVVMVAFVDAQILDITGPLEVFGRTTRWLRDHVGHSVPAYEIELVAHEAGALRTSSGLQLIATRSYRDIRRADTVLMAGGIGYERALQDKALLAWIRRHAAAGRRVGSVCTGALVLATAGILRGETATTHWAYCDRLEKLAPDCRVERDAIYVRNGKLYTSAGVTAGMDMALAMVEEDWGKSTALAVAQELVMFLKRPGGQSQFSRHLQAQRRDDQFGELELWILENIHRDLPLEKLARRVSMSVRHFSRRFREQLGTSPSAHVVRLRVEAARRRIEAGARQMKEVARQCGFSDEQALRRAFQRVLGVVPADYRERFGEQPGAPSGASARKARLAGSEGTLTVRTSPARSQ